MVGIRRTAAAYLTAQAVAGGVWWLSLFVWPATRDAYWPGKWPVACLLAFWLPDGLLFVGGSAAAAWLVARRSPCCGIALWVTGGATLYAALFCVSVWIMTGEASGAAVAMVPAALGTLWVATNATRRGAIDE